MKKNLIALAIASAIAVPAMAQNVTLSGRASIQMDNWKATGAAAGAASDFNSRNRVTDTGSRFTFAVREDLGGGLSAGVYCETGINIDNASSTGAAGTINPNTSEWCSREGHARVGNQFIDFRLGRQNVWWTQGALNMVGSTYVGSDTATNLLNGSSTTVTPFGVRLPNMILLHANSGFGAFAGSQVYMGYDGNDGAQNAAAGVAFPTPVTTGEAAAAGQSATAKYNGLKVNWAQGAFFAMVDIQRAENPLGGSSTASRAPFRDKSLSKLGLGWRFMGAGSPSTVSLQMWDNNQTSTAGAKSGNDGYAVVASYDMGGGLMLHGQYGKANALSTAANTGAVGTTLGVTKAFSKRTHIYGAMHNIKNDAAGTFGMSGGNYQSGTPAAGSDTSSMALGIIHNF